MKIGFPIDEVFGKKHFFLFVSVRASYTDNCKPLTNKDLRFMPSKNPKIVTDKLPFVHSLWLDISLFVCKFVHSFLIVSKNL